MSTIFTDRESAYPNRYRVIPESGNPYYIVLERADEPITPGTPLNAETFNKMRDEIASESAPNGFGLGKKTDTLPRVSTKEEVDALICAGWYEYYNGDVQCCGFPGTQYGGILVVPSMHAYTQFFFCRNYYEGYLMRRYDGAAWKEWEWVNPPMFGNVEYRTTERWNGKPVYRKLVKYTSASDIGSNSSYTDINIPHSISGFKSLVRCNIVGNEDSNLPFVSQSGSVTAMTRIDATNVCLRIVNDVWSAPTFAFDIAYIKE